MITPVNHTQPQFRAKMYSCDISVLYNEAKRSNEAKKAISELAGMLRTLEKIHGQKASLELCTGGNQGKQYKILLDDKPVSSSTKSFIETLKELLSSKQLYSKNPEKELSGKELSERYVQRFALDA